MARKLKGRKAKKATKKQKETLERMDKAREKDNEVLRDRINKTLEWLQTNKQIALKNIEHYQKIVRDQQTKLERTRGAITALEGILEGDLPNDGQKH